MRRRCAAEKEVCRGKYKECLMQSRYIFANNLLYNRKEAEEDKTFSAFLFHVEHFLLQ